MTNMRREELSSSRLNLIPEFEALRTPNRAEPQRLFWVPRGTVRTIRGICTKGGYYVQLPGGTPFSFAVDELLPVGSAEKARPLSLRPGQSVGYRQFDPDQRAAYLHWLSSENRSANATDFCVQLHVGALEWSLFVQRANPTALIDELFSVLPRPDPTADAPLLRLLAWSAFFQDRNLHIAVIAELVASGFRLNGSLVRLLLSDCAEAGQCLSAELAVEVERVLEQRDDASWDSDFRERFDSRFRVLYPNGLRIAIGPRQTEANYNLLCPELSGERCRLVVYDTVQATLSALRQVTAPLTCKQRLDQNKATRISEETARTQTFLSDRCYGSPVSASVVSQLPLLTPRSELTKQSIDLLFKLIVRAEWSGEEFQRLAKVHGQMPFAVIEQLNSWAIENFDEALLFVGSRVTINKNLINEIKRKYE